jgi:hypothetical protein
MITEERPNEYAAVMRPMMLNELIPAAASMTVVALLSIVALTLV